MKIAVAAVTVLLLAGCASTGAPATTSQVKDKPAVTHDDGVDWSAYAPVVETRIKGEIAKGQCAKLQDEFDSADHNQHLDLMMFIDSAMKDAGCYG